MSRFILSEAADRDIDDILEHLDAIEKAPARRIGRNIQRVLTSIGRNPFLGSPQSEFTRLAGTEIRSRLVESYRIFYTVGAPTPEIVAILHTARDIHSIMACRLQ